MFQSLNRFNVIGLWLALAIAAAGVGALSGASITLSVSALWLVACVVPPIIMLMVWRGVPPPTVGELLYATDRRA